MPTIAASPRPRLAAAILGVSILAILIALCWLRGKMHPIQPGTTAEFWACACNVALPEYKYPAGHGPATIRDGQCFYAVQGYHGQYLYRVREADAMPSFPAVLAELERRAAAASPADYAAQGYRRWQAMPEARRTPQMLFDQITDALVDNIRANPRPWPLAGAEVLEARTDFYESLRKADFYWATLLFELLFLSALVLILTLPLWRKLASWQRLACWATAPFLFYLPFWLGFAAQTRPPWGPSGGILYPWLVWFTGRPPWNSSWELTFLSRLPPLLSPISQNIDGPILSLTGSSIPGPLYASYGALALCVLAVTLMFLVREQKQPGGQARTQ